MCWPPRQELRRVFLHFVLQIAFRSRSIWLRDLTHLCAGRNTTTSVCADNSCLPAIKILHIDKEKDQGHEKGCYDQFVCWSVVRDGCRWKGIVPTLMTPTHNEFLVSTADWNTICLCKSKQRTCHIETRGGRKHRAPSCCSWIKPFFKGRTGL